MCLATPMKVEYIKGPMAGVTVGDVKSTISIQLINKVKTGDYVLVHAGIAIEKINRARAKEILSLLNELGRNLDKKR